MISLRGLYAQVQDLLGSLDTAIEWCAIRKANTGELIVLRSLAQDLSRAIADCRDIEDFATISAVGSQVSHLVEKLEELLDSPGYPRGGRA